VPEISIAAYTRSETTAKHLHVNVYPNPLPSLPKMMEVRAGDVALYLNVNDAFALAEAMLAEIRSLTAA
jgi:hypothetical protein